MCNPLVTLIGVWYKQGSGFDRQLAIPQGGRGHLIEELAIQYVSMSEGTTQLIYYGLAAVGGIVAAIVVKSKTEIARAPFFAYYWLIIFLFSCVQVIWLLSINAMAGGYLWVLITISFAASIASGFFIYQLGMARSYDAFGNARSAFLAFIPILGLVLLCTRTKEEATTNRILTIPLVSGGLGVLTGFVLFAASVGVNAYIKEQGRNLVQQAKFTPAEIKADIERMLRFYGLEKTLRLLAAEYKKPIAIDKVTTVARYVANGKQLRLTYLIDSEEMLITEKFRERIRDGICKSEFLPILRAGGSIRMDYLERGGREIGSVMFTGSDC